MDAKIAELMDILRVEGEIAPAELAARLGVSVRTVRTYINRANALLAGSYSSAGGIGMRSTSVYYLEDNNRPRLNELLDHVSSRPLESVPSTVEERVAYLLNDLLCRNEWVTIEDCAQSLFVSRATVSEDLRQVEKRLAHFDLVVERRPRYGIRVTGSELKRRLCLAALWSGEEPLSASMQLPDPGAVSALDACVDEATRKVGFHINALARHNLLVHLSVAICRIREGCHVSLGEEQLERIRATREFSVAGDIARALEQGLGIELPESEVAYVAIHLAGRQRLFFSADAPENRLAISDEAWDVAGRMVGRVWDASRLDFRDDIELRMNLAQHVMPLSVRLRFHMRMANPLLSEIKERYPLAWTTANEASSVLVDTYGTQVSEEEIGYLALAFALALERKKGVPERKNILIACASGEGSARLLEHRFRQEFGAYLDRIEICDVASIDTIDLSDIDYAFTTVPLGRALSVPVREVGFFLSEGDIRQVCETLASNRPESGIEAYFDEGLFFPHLVAAGKSEALDGLCALVAERRAVPQDFAGLVWERERAGLTSFGNRVSMPHPARPCTSDTFVAVALLDEPVLWARETPVSAIFLVSISTDDNKDLQDFYDRMARLLSSKEDIEALISQRNFSVLLELLNR